MCTMACIILVIICLRFTDHIISQEWKGWNRSKPFFASTRPTPTWDRPQICKRGLLLKEFMLPSEYLFWAILIQAFYFWYQITNLLAFLTYLTKPRRKDRVFKFCFLKPSLDTFNLLKKIFTVFVVSVFFRPLSNVNGKYGMIRHDLAQIALIRHWI